MHNLQVTVPIPAVSDVFGPRGGGVLPDTWIKIMAEEHGMIEPFVPESIRDGVISYGLTSYGYDFRIGNQFKVFHNAHNALVDPKALDPRAFITVEDERCIIPPNSFVLTYTVEYFRIPPDVITICLGKSTYARCGLIVNVTPFEPGWEGHATIEISNTTPLPAVIYANEGAGQVLFLQGLAPCSISYADKDGKYQKQAAEVVLPRIEQG